jgi:hypothetical protein
LLQKYRFGSLITYHETVHVTAAVRAVSSDLFSPPSACFVDDCVKLFSLYIFESSVREPAIREKLTVEKEYYFCCRDNRAP